MDEKSILVVVSKSMEDVMLDIECERFCGFKMLLFLEKRDDFWVMVLVYIFEVFNGFNILFDDLKVFLDGVKV